MKARLLVSILAGCAIALAATSSAFAVGKPVAPGNGSAQTFLPAQSCGCHGTLIQNWQPSMHAQAIKDPVFRLKVSEARKQAGEDVARFCERCHSPVGNMLSEFDGAGQVSGEGVACMFCHQVSGMAPGEPGNVSHLVQPDLTRRAQIKDPGAPHPAVYSALHESAEFCGGCHNVNHPANGTHLESTYSEWKASGYAKKGVVCQDCHMSSRAGLVGPSKGSAAMGAPERANMFAMTFVGANVGQGPAEESAALLKSAAKIAIEAPEITAEGETASVTVTVSNTGAGHYLPTGLTEVREMWLTVYAEDAAGKRTKLGERFFGSQLKDAKGNSPVEVWAATDIASDDRIPPNGSVAGSYVVTMPAGSESAKIGATLDYRSLPDALAGAAKVENPTTVMASAEKSIYSSQAAKDAAAATATKQEPKAPASSPNLLVPLGIGGLIVLVAAGFVVWRMRSGR